MSDRRPKPFPFPFLVRHAIPAGCLFLSVLLATSSIGAAEEDTVSENVSVTFKQIIQALSEHGLHFEPDKARTAVIQAVIRTADPAGTILSEEEWARFKEEREGKTYALGVTLSMSNGAPRIERVLPGSPAEEAGLLAGQTILRIGETAISRSDIVRVGQRLRTAEATPLRLVLRTELEETNTVEVTTRLIQLPGIETIEVFPSDLCYIRLNGLYPGTAGQILDAMKAWRTNEYFGFVIDLRSAGGDDVDGAAKVASLFTEANMMLFSFRNGENQDIKVYKADKSEPLGMPTMVLVDENTTGAAEVLAAALKRSIRGAMVLGATSKGDAEIREAVELEPSKLLYIATKRLVTADGTVYDGTAGVVPDVKVKPGTDTDEPENVELETIGHKRETLEEELEDTLLRERIRGDAALRRAVDILLGLKALNIRGIKHAPDPTG